MSRLSKALSRVPTHPSGTGAAIDLADNTVHTREERVSGANLEEDPSNILKKTQTRVRIKEELQRRKYAKYAEDCYAPDTAGASTSNPDGLSAVRDGPGEGHEAILGALTPTATSKNGRVQRGQQKLKDIVGHRNHVRRGLDADAEIDILYENQRGSWLLGQPLFSARSLLNFDPSAWTSAAGIRSAVNITNAQLPDPSWEWDWKTWYVDMSQDVDEQGWQYSFMFNNNLAWHGTHPWFHSFVRRRRWIRKRTRRRTAIINPQSHQFPIKFTVHGQDSNAEYSSSSPAASPRGEGTFACEVALDKVQATHSDVHDGGETRVDNAPFSIGLLLRRLKQSTMDREKIHCVLQYMEHGDEDAQYLAQEMSHIMSIFTFQQSRRQLLASMLQFLENEERPASPDSTGEGGDPRLRRFPSSCEHTGENFVTTAARKHANLVLAVEVAERESKNIEYWSDMRENSMGAHVRGTADRPQ